MCFEKFCYNNYMVFFNAFLDTSANMNNIRLNRKKGTFIKLSHLKLTFVN